MIKLTPSEVEFFNNISKTEMGKFLLEYMRKVQNYAYDSRNWGPDGDRKTAEGVAQIIEDCVIKKISPIKKQESITNEME